MEQIKKTEIVFYDKGKTTELFPKTEINSVIDTSTGLTVRQYIDEIKSGIKDIEEVSIPELENRVTELEDKEVDLSSYYTKVEVDNKVASQNIYIQGIDERVNDLENADNLEPEDFKTINGESLIGSGDIKVQVEIDTSDLATKEELESLDNKKQDSLVSGQNIKSINGESLVGSGNLILEAEGLEVIEVTQEEYDNLTSYDPNVLYAISDGIMGLQFRVLTEAEYNSLTSYSDNIVYVVKDKPSKTEVIGEIQTDIDKLKSMCRYSLNWFNKEEIRSGVAIGEDGVLYGGYDESSKVSGLIDLDLYRRVYTGHLLPYFYYYNPNGNATMQIRYRFLDSNKNVVSIPDFNFDSDTYEPTDVMSGTISDGGGYQGVYPDYARYIQFNLPENYDELFICNYNDLAIYKGGDGFPEYKLETFNSMCALIMNLEKRIKALEDKE